MCSVDRDATCFEQLVGWYREWLPSTDRFVVGATQSEATYRSAAYWAPYDVLLVDAGHLLDDVRRDVAEYSKLVRSGGVVALHDSLLRSGYEAEVEVWRLLPELRASGLAVTDVGTEVGWSWWVKP